MRSLDAPQREQISHALEHCLRSRCEVITHVVVVDALPDIRASNHPHKSAPKRSHAHLTTRLYLQEPLDNSDFNVRPRSGLEQVHLAPSCSVKLRHASTQQGRLLGHTTRHVVARDPPQRLQVARGLSYGAVDTTATDPTACVS